MKGMAIVKFPDYSVLMSVYKKENEDHLRIAMDSIWNQTVRTNDFVLICDGPLTDGLNAVISEMEQKHPEELRVIRFEENRGLGPALREGVKECKNELIARMDSDDISKPDRCEKELGVFMERPDISIVSSALEEFVETDENGMPSAIIAVRDLPETPEEVLAFAKKRCPFNHPSVMYKRSAVLASGNYQEFYHMEDYLLWVKILQNGYKGYNLRESLLWMRAGSEMYKRRSGLGYAKSQYRMFQYMRKSGFISRSQRIKSTTLRVGAALAPNALRERAYKKVLRKN